MTRDLPARQVADLAALTFERFIARGLAAQRSVDFECIEVYPCMLEWGEFAAQLRGRGLSNRDIAFAIALAVPAP